MFDYGDEEHEQGDGDDMSLSTNGTGATVQSNGSGLSDLGAKRSPNTMKMRKQANNKFSVFLRGEKSRYANFDACPAAYFTQILVGLFAAFLVKTVKAMNTALNMLSAARMLILTKHKTSLAMRAEIKDPEWYKGLRRNITSEFVKKRKPGQLLAKKAPALTVEDLHTIGRLLFTQNTKRANDARGVLTNGFQSMGRIMETAKYQNQDLTAHKNMFSTTLKFIMEKTKTGTVVEIQTVPHAVDMYSCSWHSIAVCRICGGGERSGPMFETFRDVEHVSSVFNEILKQVFTDWSRGEQEQFETGEAKHPTPIHLISLLYQR